MKAMFCVVEKIGSGILDPLISDPWRPWFADTVRRWSGNYIGDWYGCNVFHEDQTVLDSIAGDVRTKFVVPIEVTGKGLEWQNKNADLPPNTIGKITSWIAKAKLQKLHPAMKKPGQVAKHIMAQFSGTPEVDPLNGFRVHWTE